MHNRAKSAGVVMGDRLLIDDLTDEATPPCHTAVVLSRRHQDSAF